MRTNIHIGFNAVVLLCICFAARPASASIGDALSTLHAGDGGTNNECGWSVDISSEVAVVSAWQDDDNGNRSGSAYLFNTVTGGQLRKILPSDGVLHGEFGVSVAISGDKTIIGARASENNTHGSGAAYIFDVGTGAELLKLRPRDDARGDWFGWSVDISNDIAIVGAQQDDENGALSGAAYLFDATTGEELFKLRPSDAAPADYFGVSVAIDGNTAIVGAYQNRNPPNPGAAYLFDVTTGDQLAKLTPSDPGSFDWFGCSVAISGDWAIVGAWRDDDNGDDSGSAYLFDAKTGVQLAKLRPNDGVEGHEFGRSVAISGNLAIVGAIGDDDNGSYSGAAYLFDVISGTQVAKLTASDGSAGDFFGVSVSLDGNNALVGAHLDDDLGINSGSAYLFSTVPEPSALLLSILSVVTLLGRNRGKAVAAQQPQCVSGEAPIAA